jgi:RNA-directed DNA polymerase
MVHRPTGRWYLAAQPSKKSVARLRESVRKVLRPGNMEPWPKVVRQVNRKLVGWSNYFSYGTVTRAHWHVNTFLLERARYFLTRRHKGVSGRGTWHYPADEVFGAMGLMRLGMRRRAVHSNALA